MSNFIPAKTKDMDLNELIESTLRNQHLEEMQNRPRKEYSPTKGMTANR